MGMGTLITKHMENVALQSPQVLSNNKGVRRTRHSETVAASKPPCHDSSPQSYIIMYISINYGDLDIRSRAGSV